MKNEVKEFRLDEISILCIIRDLLKNIWVILLAAAAGWFAVTGVMSFLYVPEFTARPPWQSVREVTAMPIHICP